MSRENKKKIINIIILYIIVLCMTSCGKEKVPKPVEGKYVSADGSSYIVLSDYTNESPKDSEDVFGKCRLQFTNVDLTAFAEFCILNATGNYISVNKLGNLSQEELAGVKKRFEDSIDLKKQFIDHKAEFEYFYSEEEKGYGFMCEIEGSGFDGAYECYVSAEYVADEKAIICDEVKYILED